MRTPLPIIDPSMPLRSAGLGLVLSLALVSVGCVTTAGAKKNAEPDSLVGRVEQTGGRGIAFAKISVLPQARYDDPNATKRQRKKRAEEPPLPEAARGLAVTTEVGEWVIDHLSDGEGTDLGMPRGYYYELSVYKAGYHPFKEVVLYEQGTLAVDVALVPDNIDLDDPDNMVDTSVDDTQTGAGVTRQGE